MKFLFPSFLWALLAVAIPIVIHLFRFRRFKTIYFSNVQFLRKIQNEKQSTNKLKHLLVLLLRILTIIFLVLAFAQPYFPNDKKYISKGKNSLSIYIDNSQSMDNSNADNTLFESAISVARQIVKSYNQNDEFQIITNNVSLREQRFYNQEQILGMLDEIQSGKSPLKMVTAIEKSNNLQKEAKSVSKTIYVISDFQKNSSKADQLVFDSLLNYVLMPLTPSDYSNVYIDSVWFDVPILNLGQQLTLKTRIVNTGQNPVEEGTLRLSLNGNQKLSTYNVAAKSSSIVELIFTVNEVGWNKGILSIDDYPVTFDDKYFISFYVKDICNILSLGLNGSSSFLKTVFSTDPYFKFNEIDAGNIDFSVFKNQQLIIVNEMNKIPSGLAEELLIFANSGGNVLIIPSSGILNFESYNTFFSKIGKNSMLPAVNGSFKCSKIDKKEDIINNVFEKIDKNMDLPVVKKYYPFSNDKLSNEKKIISLENNSSLLSKVIKGQGNFFILSVPLNSNFSNFQRHAIFVPIMYQLALNSSVKFPLANILASNRSFILNIPFKNLEDNDYHFKIDEKEFVPEMKRINGVPVFYINEDFKEAGFYQLTQGNSSNNKTIAYAAFNFNRAESQLAAYSETELRDLIKHKNVKIKEISGKNVKSEMEEIHKGKPLWKTLIILTLIALLLEILVIRYFDKILSLAFFKRK